MPDMMLSARNIGHGFGRGEPLFEDLSLEVPAGRTTILIGPNGCGKSTLMSILAGIETPDRGRVFLEGRDLARLGPRQIATVLGFLPQSPSAMEGSVVRDLVSLGRMPHRSLFAMWSQTDELLVAEALEDAGLSQFADRKLSALSGGQRQRAFIAMVLAQQPRIMLLDEPSSFLDVAHQLNILEILDERKKRSGTTIVAAFHDIAQAAQIADHLVVMRTGQIVAEGPPADVLDPELLADVFGVEFRIFRDPESGQLVVLPMRHAHAREDRQ